MLSFRDVLVGPFTGLAIYRRAVSSTAWRPLGVLVAMLLICALVLAGVRYAEMSARLATVADSELYLMPRVTVDGDEVRVDGAAGRLFDATEFVVLLDPVSVEPVFPSAAPGDKRPRVLVAADGLWIFSSRNPAPAMLPWSQVTFAEGTLSLDGPDLMDWLAVLLRRVILFGLFGLGSVFLVYQLLLQGLFVFLYRTLLPGGPNLPAFGTLFNCATLVALPVLPLATLSLLCGVEKITALGLHGCLLGLWFLVAVSHVRLADEAQPQGSATSPETEAAGLDTPTMES